MAFSRIRCILTLFAAAIIPASVGAQEEAPTRISDFRPGADDYSIEMLRQAFGPVIDTALGGAQADGGSPLAAMMAVYLSGVVAVGVAFFVYLTARSVWDTAQDGEFLGKQLGNAYMPLRLAGGVSLLLPLASGFCLLQLIIFWVASMGVGLANLGGSQALAAIEDRGSLTMPSIPSARGLASNILIAEVCRAAYNAEKEAAQEPSRIQREISLNSENSLVIRWNAAQTSYITSQAACGSLTFSRNDAFTRLDDTNLSAPMGPIGLNPMGYIQDARANARLTETFEAAHRRAIERMIQDLAPAADTIVRGERLPQDAITAAAQRYELYIQQAARAALAEARSMGVEQRQRFDEDVLARQGWIYWGAYYNHLTAQQDAMQSAANMTPSFRGGAIQTQEVNLTRFDDALIAAREYIRAAERAPGMSLGADEAGAPECEFSPVTMLSAEGVMRTLEGCVSTVSYQITRDVADVIGGDNTSHVAQTRELGHVMINAGYASVVVQIVAQLLATNVGSAAGGGLGISNMITPMFTGLHVYLFGVGSYLAYYLPLVPFLIWLPAVLKWLIAAFEAAIAAPLWAAAHIHPDGDERVGMAGPGYMLLLSLFMRPILMVFGMVGAILLANPAIGFINSTFAIAIAGAMSGDSISGLLGILSWLLIYCIALTTMMHGIFSLVHYIPDNVPRWIGHAIGIHGASDASDERQGSSVFYAGMSTVQANTGTRGDPRNRRGKPPRGTAPSTGDGDGANGGGGSSSGRRTEDSRQREHQRDTDL